MFAFKESNNKKTLRISKREEILCMSPGKKSEDDAIRHMLYTEEFTQAQKNFPDEKSLLSTDKIFKEITCTASHFISPNKPRKRNDDCKLLRWIDLPPLHLHTF